jgi:hypothetical protein
MHVSIFRLDRLADVHLCECIYVYIHTPRSLHICMVHGAYMYVYIHGAYMYVCIHGAYMYVDTSRDPCTYTCTYTSFLYMLTFLYVHVHVHIVYMYICTCTCTLHRSCACMLTNLPVRAHMHMHAIKGGGCMPTVRAHIHTCMSTKTRYICEFMCVYVRTMKHLKYTSQQ